MVPDKQADQGQSIVPEEAKNLVTPYNFQAVLERIPNKPLTEHGLTGAFNATSSYKAQ